MFLQDSNLATTTAPKAVENDYVEDRINNGHVNGPVGSQKSTADTYANIGNLENGDLVQFAWQIASGMVSSFMVLLYTSTQKNKNFQLARAIVD